MNGGGIVSPMIQCPSTTPSPPQHPRFDRSGSFLFSRNFGGGSTTATAGWIRRALLLLPLTWASFSLLRQARMVVMVVEDPRASRSATTASFTPEQLAAMTRFVSTPPEGDDNVRKPEIVWLASYPNSGTSYTMTLVERASNLSTATNYGDEVTREGDTSVPVHNEHFDQGPFWEGLHGRLGRTVRQLPDSFVLTKSHCSGRCVHCGASQYVVKNASEFAWGCLRTSGRANGTRFESYMDPSRLARVVHLIRNPFHNVVARYHLDRRHLVKKDPNLVGRYPYNATGFQRWCRELDDQYEDEEVLLAGSGESSPLRRLLRQVPCRGEFYKYAQWHEHALAMIPHLSSHRRLADRPSTATIPVLVVHYEDYHDRFNWSVTRLMDFVEQDVVSELRPFRSLPTYEDHYSTDQLRAVRDLIRHLASSRLWRHLERYFQY